MKTYAPPKLRQVVTEAVFRRRRIVLSTVFIVVGLTLLVTLLMHKKYQADAKLMVQNVRSAAPLTTSPTDKLVQNGDVSTAEINSEADLLQSQATMRRALEGPNPPATTTAREQEAILQLQHRITVDPVHQSNNIDVKILGDSPADAERQLQSVIDAYFEVRAQSGRNSGAAEFFEKQTQQKGAQVDLDQQALTEFEVKHNLADLDEQKKLQVTRIASIEDRLADVEAALARQSSKTNAERRQLAITPSRTNTTQRTTTNQYTQEHLNTQLVDLQTRRSELLKRYVPTDRQVVEVNEKIGITQRAIADARTHPADESATDVNPTWQQLSASVATSSGEVSGLAAQHVELVRQHNEANARLHELQESTVTYDVLRRKLAQSQDDLKLYSQKRDEARISEALDREKMFDVSLIVPPTASLDPVRPKPVLYLLVAFLFSLFLGIVLALYSDTSAEQVYNPSQLDSITGTRTVATFADEDDSDGAQASNQVEYRRVLGAFRSGQGIATRAPGVAADSGLCVAVVSALRREGTTHLAANLAEEAARQPGAKIALLDMLGLLRIFESEGTVSFGLKLNERRGYWTLAPSETGVAPVTPVLQSDAEGQFSARLVPLLIQARKQFEFVLLDCPSLQDSTLAVELDPCVDGYIAVIGAGSARKQNIEQLTDALKSTRAPLLGYVLNRRRYPVPRWLHRVMW